MGGLLGNPKGTIYFTSWNELTTHVSSMALNTVQPFTSRNKAFDGEGFYGNDVQGFIIKGLEDNVLIFGVASDGSLVFRKRNYPDTSTWGTPKKLLQA